MKKNKHIIQICISSLSFFLILFSGYQLIKIYSDYRKSDLLYENTRSSFSEVTVEEDIVEKTITQQNENSDTVADSKKLQKSGYGIAVDFEELQKINSDIVGWIYFENMDISYPLLYSGDDEKYLTTTYTGEVMTAGSIFVEGANNPDFSDRHTIIYGHNLSNLSMFGKLRYYRLYEAYYKSHKFFWIITPEASYKYQVFSYREVSADSDVYDVSFGDYEEFENFVSNVLTSEESRRCDFTLTEESRIITLSTCSDNDKRFIVSAIRVDEEK